MKLIRDDGLELGEISECPYFPKSKYGAYYGSGTWSVTSSQGGSKYFVHYDSALKWLERQSKYVYPISRLNEFLR